VSLTQSDRNIRILVMRLNGKTYKAIAEEFGFTPVRAYQLCAKAQNRLIRRMAPEDWPCGRDDPRYIEALRAVIASLPMA
jgi:hypothetical protein